jgi:hypothetical protein
VAELSKAELNELVEEAVMDAHDEDEAITGFFTMIENNLALPFTTTVLGVQAKVADIGVTGSGIVAICTRGKHRQAISFIDLPLPEPPPRGWEWIAAYRHWAGRR